MPTYTLTVKELKSATLQRLASFESPMEIDKSKRKQHKIYRSTSENMHEYRPGCQHLTTLTVDDSYPGLEMLNVHAKDTDMHLRRRIVSSSESQPTMEDIFRRSLSAQDRVCVKDETTNSDGELQKDIKANIVEEEEVEKGSVRPFQKLYLHLHLILQLYFASKETESFKCDLFCIGAFH